MYNLPYKSFKSLSETKNGGPITKNKLLRDFIMLNYKKKKHVSLFNEIIIIMSYI